MRFFKKKKSLKAVAEGRLIPLVDVDDAVFSKKMMGPGFAITEHTGQVYAPVSGKILNIFPTLHAITLESQSGETILIHMGLDTVDLKGAPFSLLIAENETISCGQKLAEMNLALLKNEAKDPVIIVVLPETDKGEIIKGKEHVSIEDDVFKL